MLRLAPLNPTDPHDACTPQPSKVSNSGMLAQPSKVSNSNSGMHHKSQQQTEPSILKRDYVVAFQPKVPREDFYQKMLTFSVTNYL